MSQEQSPDGPSRSTIVSRSPGLAYERMRETRTSHFGQSLVGKLTVQGGLLAVLALSLVMVLAAGGGRVGSADVAVLAGAGGALVAAGATAHAGVGVYRLRREPLTEREALALVTVEDAAAYLGLACGGLLVAATVAVAALGWADGAGANAELTVATGAVAAGAAIAAAVSLTAGSYLRGRLPRRP